MHKAKIRQEKNDTGITCEETELNQALEEIIEKEHLADEKAPRQRKKKRKKKQLESNTGKALWNVYGRPVKGIPILNNSIIRISLVYMVNSSSTARERLTVEFFRRERRSRPSPLTVHFVVLISFVDDAYISGEINRIKIEARSEPAEEMIKKLKKIVSCIFVFLAYRICLMVLELRGKLKRNRVRSILTIGGPDVVCVNTLIFTWIKWAPRMSRRDSCEL